MRNVSKPFEILNEQQQAAVLHHEGPAIVLAGAGSGKTRVLTTRVAWLIEEQKVSASQILLVTFTNKAAQEMNNRVAELTGSKLPFSGTFHRVCASILRRDGYHLGLSPGFSIYDSDDQLTLIKQIYKTHSFNPKEYNPQAVKATISRAKNEMITWEEYQKFAQGAFQDFTARVYKLYQMALREQQAVDFDDLLLLVVKLFQTHKEVLGKYQQQIEHVLIDEYQDTNKVQYELTKFFSRPQNNIYVVGDFAQSIYAWRGADYRNLLRLKEDFANITEYRLEQNYRSTQTILDAATQIISKSTEFPILQLWTENKITQPLTVLETETGESEAQQIIEEIQSSHFNYNHVAILYRTNAQSRPFEEALVRAGIPYKLVGGFKFYERKEIKDVLAYLRLVVNPQDTVSLERVIKLGKNRFAHFDAWRQTFLKNQADDPENTHLSPLELLQHILKESDYLSRFDKNDPEEFQKLENIQELQNVAAQFTDASVFLENIALVQDDYLADAPSDEPRNAITLMSLHSAKGLEFPVVFMVGMEDGLLPHSRSLMDKAQMEEERRLCYVGITRAREQLYFSYARLRWIFGTPTYGLRSRFLRDIPTALLTEKSTTSFMESEYQTQQRFSQKNNWSNRWQKTPSIKPVSAQKARHLVLDDDALEGVLTGEINIKDFLEN